MDPIPSTVAHYNILERLGGGAIGDVYRARDTNVGRTVALMEPRPELLSDPGRRAAFLDAARAASQLNHPNIATLFDVVEEGDRCFLAYEFAAGPSLRQEIDGRPVNVRRAIELAAQIADALAEGHARGIVHGDIRPDTVVVTPKGSAKILNFGMAKWTGGGAARDRAALSPDSLTGEDARIAAYLSPEQALRSTIDPRSDVFSLGAVLYEMITGRNPFVGATTAATVMNVIRATPRAVTEDSRELPRELDTVVTRALTKDLDKRQQSAASLAAELRSVGAMLDVRSGDAAPADLIPIEDEPRGSAWWIVALIAAAALAAWWFLQRA